MFVLILQDIVYMNCIRNKEDSFHVTRNTKDVPWRKSTVIKPCNVWGKQRLEESLYFVPTSLHIFSKQHQRHSNVVSLLGANTKRFTSKLKQEHRASLQDVIYRDATLCKRTRQYQGKRSREIEEKLKK